MFAKTITRTVLIGDSQIKYMHTEFNPNSAGTPAFICQPGARIEDLHNLLIILHVGTNDLASTKGSVVFTRYRSLLHAVFKKCPSVRRIFGTLILPRSTNRCRGNNNRAQGQHGGLFLEPTASPVVQAFLPARGALADDRLHTSFEGTALLASYIKDISFGEKRNTRSEWSDPTVAEAAATETTEIPLTSQEEFPWLPPPPPHPAPSLPPGPSALLLSTHSPLLRPHHLLRLLGARNKRARPQLLLWERE
ncbi:hypothetical protein HPB50_024158 [Hyalomma asiaticum]|uniref:Uncharacterized protein n=1 Tax=Hyalomma asiaticum TaxID=266040 RepID=A0ACB7S545_HYAAI|nr:hypothetical protein HPB50_024158 [Hyalomma asiaticum]